VEAGRGGYRLMTLLGPENMGGEEHFIDILLEKNIFFVKANREILFYEQAFQCYSVLAVLAKRKAWRFSGVRQAGFETPSRKGTSVRISECRSSTRFRYVKRIRASA